MALAFGRGAGAGPRAGGLARDPDAPLVVLARLLDLHLGQRDPKAALGAIEMAARSGLVREADVDRVPRLGMLVRRVQAENAASVGR